jgi:hypothetical protein
MAIGQMNFKKEKCILRNNLRKRTGIYSPTAIGLLRHRSNDILKELRPGSGRLAAVLCFPALLNIAEGRPIL